MKKLRSTALVAVCLFAAFANAQAQQPSEQASIALDIKVIDVSSDRIENFEKVVTDRASLDRLISEGKARPITSAQARARSGDQISANVGQRIPIQSSRQPQGAPQFQYENTGLNINARPSVIAGDQILVDLRLELSALDSSTGRFTPSFVQRTISDKVQLRSGETVILLNVIQHEQMWPTPPQTGAPTSSESRGSFVVLLTARILN